MIPEVVVDVGNSFIKWGRCQDGMVIAKASLPPDEPAIWEKQLEQWNIPEPIAWVVCGVHPERREFLVKWLRLRTQDTVHVIDKAQQLPLRIEVEQIERVGIDRLLDAVAANAWRNPKSAAIVIDAGSAVTVDCIDDAGTFHGGSIFPGLRLMAQALHDHTALLPLVRVESDHQPLPGRSTIAAMEAGIFWAVAGGIVTTVEQMVRHSNRPTDHFGLEVFLTGGDCRLLEPTVARLLSRTPFKLLRLHTSAHMTLEGIRLAAETLT